MVSGVLKFPSLFLFNTETHIEIQIANVYAMRTVAVKTAVCCTGEGKAFHRLARWLGSDVPPVLSLYVT